MITARDSRPGAAVLALGAVLSSGLLPGCSARCSEAPAVPEASFVQWQDRIEVDAGQAHVGPWRMNDSVWRYVDDPTVAIDPQGRVAVAWVDQARREGGRPQGTC